MSTNHTTNYDLNQWEGTDKVLRTEFNADNAKIDAALKANADAIAAEAAAREAGETKFIVGHYIGTGASGSIHYTVGAKPKFLFLAVMSDKSGAHYCGLLAAENFYLPFYSSTGMTGQTGMITFTDDGFTINHLENRIDSAFNRSGVTYRYLAIC